jgi:hypothetical protein
MALLTVKKPQRLSNGTLFGAVAAAGGGDSFANTGVEFFYAKNASGGSITITFDSPNTCTFELTANAAHDLAVVLAAGEERIMGPFPPGRFNDGNNLVQITYSGVTTLTVTPLAPA